MPEDYAARERDAINRRVDELAVKLKSLDEHGSRGVVALQVRIDELIKDVAELGIGMASIRAEIEKQSILHEQTHKDEEDRRVSRSRWLIGVALAIGGLAGGFIGHVIEKLL